MTSLIGTLVRSDVLTKLIFISWSPTQREVNVLTKSAEFFRSMLGKGVDRSTKCANSGPQGNLLFFIFGSPYSLGNLKTCGRSSRQTSENEDLFMRRTVMTYKDTRNPSSTSCRLTKKNIVTYPGFCDE
jgi:hypothetical protein